MLTLLALVAPALGAVPAFDACPAEAEIEELLAPHLEEALDTWRIVRLDPYAIDEARWSGDEVVLPAVDEMGGAAEVALRVSEADFADLERQVVGKGDGDEEIALPDDYTAPFVLGCDAADGACGVITFFSADRGEPTLYEGVIMGDATGSLYFESASTLLANATGISLDEIGALDPGCGVVYNGLHHVVLDGVDDLGDGEEHDDGPEHDHDDDDEEEDPFIRATVNIVLDADRKFYELGKSTVWARQRALYNTVALSYGLVEPLIGSNFSLHLKLESQETWVSGGPDTKDGHKLKTELNDSKYFMLNHPTKNEVSFFYYGVDVDTRLAGVAGGVCGLSGYDVTWGSNRANQSNHAWAQQVRDASGFAFHSLKGRIGVMAHEVGHMFGGTHGDGAANTRRTGGLFSVSGNSVMSSPAVTETWFTADNADNVYTCLDRVF